MVVVSHLFPFYRKILPNYSYFNPRLREGGDILSEISSKVIIISIHASEKEATFTAFLAALFKRISIHASEQEATQTANGAQQTAQISIHASEKEATPFQRAYEHLCRKFQSTPPKRRRRRDCLSCLDWVLFQSTPPKRRRRAFHSLFIPANVISIHASEKEATATYCDTSAIMYISSLNNFFVHYF